MRAVLGIKRNAYTGRDICGFLRQLKRLRHLVEDPTGYPFDAVNPVEAAHDDRKFVTSEPRDGICLANKAGQPVRGFPQQAVADLMSQCIVDILELIEIQV